MKTSSLIAIAAASLFTSFGALAESPTAEPVQALSSSLTPAQVRSELIAALAAGTVSRGEQATPVAAPTGMALTRAQVRAELAQALAGNALARGESVFVAEDQARAARPLMARAAMPVTAQ